MRLLIADDDAISRALLERTVRDWQYQVTAVENGTEAWEILRDEDPPKMAILDWMMPGIDGVEVCRRVAQLGRQAPTYILLLSGRHLKRDVAAALTCGANDYIVKPFDRQELRSRLEVGKRMIATQQELARQVRELEKALSQVRQLQGLLPICSYCKCVRDDRNYWQQVDAYLAAHADIRFSHGICPSCYEAIVEPELQAEGMELPARRG